MRRFILLAFTTALFSYDVSAETPKPVNPLNAGSAKHDKHAPIDITSDALEVFQEQNKAVFTGRVIAIQADMRLTCDVMTVHYRKSGSTDAAENSPAKPKPAKADANGEKQSSIEKIDTVGHVFVSNPEETASGDTGFYDVDGQQIHLDGNVILTRGENVLKGTHLVTNLANGKSTLTAGNGDKSGKAEGARVHSVFFPGSDKPDKKKQQP